MNQNQKISIFDNPELRKKLVTEIARICNNRLTDDKQKITDADIDKFINNQQYIKNYKKAVEIANIKEKMHQARYADPEVMSVNSDNTSLRWGFMVFNDGDTIEKQIQNKETTLLIQNEATRKKLKNQMVLNELNMDFNILFPNNDTEALENYGNNISLCETGFLFTGPDILNDISTDNPELKTICNQNNALFLGNYLQKALICCKSIFSTLIPLEGKAPETIGILSSTALDIFKLLAPYSNQIIEFEDFKDLDKFQTYTEYFGILISKEMHFTIPEPIKLKKMVEDKIIKPGFPLQYVFKKDGKEITLSEAIANYDVEKKKFKNVTIEKIDPAKLRRINNIIQYDNVLANVDYYKHLQNSLKIRDYEGNHDELASSLEKYIKTYEEIEQIAKQKVAEDNSLVLKEVIKEEIVKNPNLIEMENNIQKLIPEFSKDIILTNDKYKELDVIIREFNTFYEKITKDMKDFGSYITMNSYDKMKELYDQVGKQINTISEQRNAISQSGNRNDIKKVNEEYRKVFENLINNDTKKILNDYLKAYNQDKQKFHYFFNSVIDRNITSVVQDMEYYLLYEQPKNEFEKERLKQMEDFVNDFNEKSRNQDINSLLENESFKNSYILANRILCSHEDERNKKNLEINSVIDKYKMNKLEALLDNINENNYSNDYPELKEMVDYILSSKNAIEEQSKSIPIGAQREDYIVKQSYDLFCKAPGKRYTEYLTIQYDSLENEKKAFTDSLKNEPSSNQIKRLAKKKSYKTASSLAHQALDSGNIESSSSDIKSKKEELNLKVPNDPEVQNLVNNFYEKNDEQYLKQSLQAIAIMNYKDQEYNNRWSITKKWYRNSHNEMLETRTRLIDQLQSKGIVLDNIDQLGFDDGKNSCARIVAKEIKRETEKSNKFIADLNKLYEAHITTSKKPENISEFQKKLGNELGKVNNNEVEKTEVKEKVGVEEKKTNNKQISKNSK